MASQCSSHRRSWANRSRLPLLDLVDGDAVHGCDVVGRFAGGDEFGDGLGADTAGQGGFAEPALGIEDDRDGAAQGVEPLGVAVTVVGEVDLLHERLSRVGELQGAVATEDDQAEGGVEADGSLNFEGELAAGGVGLEGGERLADAEFLSQQRYDGTQVLQGDAAGAVLAQVAGLDELAPGDGVGSGAFLADHGGVGHASAFVAVDPAAQAVGAQPEEACGLAHAVDRAGAPGVQGTSLPPGQPAR